MVGGTSSCSATQTCSATTAWTSSITASCGSTSALGAPGARQTSTHLPGAGARRRPARIRRGHGCASTPTRSPCSRLQMARWRAILLPRVRVPWPDWIAELERTRYDNPKFVPVELLDGTRGYESECATLFPETVSVADRPVNNFGAIFCDREAERLRRAAGAAADLLRLNLPPDAARMLASPDISQQAYILWDLIHDRTHSHGELPFDPFMVRQRAPYWMYSLEELRCDLNAFMEATRLEREGVAFARYVQYAILLDRLLRFPITGPRVRNYDGLGGQLLFAFLHRHGYLQWADNRLTIDWERVTEGVMALREAIEDLYRAGIDRTKLQHWVAAHDLVAESVPPATGSKWAASSRDLPELADPRPYVDLVLEDEFPLSIFYTSLKAKLAP